MSENHPQAPQGEFPESCPRCGGFRLLKCSDGVLCCECKWNSQAPPGEKPTESMKPLGASVEGDQLVIRIGIGTLAFAAEHCERFYTGSNEYPYVSVRDQKILAAEVARRLMDHDDDGNPAIGVLLDTMVEAVWEDGCTGAFTGDNDE